MPELQPAWAWDGERLLRRPQVVWDGDGRVLEVTEGAGDGGQGLLLPGLLNGHTHLELGSLQTSPGLGLPAWVRELRSRGKAGATFAGQAVMASIRAGTAGVVDVGNLGVSAAVAQAAKLPGLYFREVIGIDRWELPDDGGRMTPHAPYSTNARLIQACAGDVWTIHFDEDPEEARFLRWGEGRWLEYLQALGRDLSRFEIPGASPAEYLKKLQVLGTHTILAHATCTRDEDLDLLAESGAAVALCIRSNLHVTGRLPDVPGMLDRGIPLLVGTDSLASSPDLDLLAETAVLAAQFPKVAPETWMRALTSTASRVTRLPLGQLKPGLAPGLLLVRIPETEDPLGTLFNGTVWPRRWLVCPQT